MLKLGALVVLLISGSLLALAPAFSSASAPASKTALALYRRRGGTGRAEAQGPEAWEWRFGRERAEPGSSWTPAAWGHFRDAVDETGWAELSVEAATAAEDEAGAFGMGYVEGALTCARIREAWDNYVAAEHAIVNGTLPARVRAFVAAQNTWMHARCTASPPPRPPDFWGHVCLVLTQWRGLARGYAEHTADPTPLTEEQLYFLTNMGDLETLLPALGAPPPVADSPLLLGECSGLVKLDPEKRNVWTGHTTFNAYSYMLRIFKHYTAHFAGVHSATLSFSSRPGDLESKDDFYVLSGGLAVLETSLAVFNHSLYARLSPETLPTWVRLAVANRLATSAAHWCALFADLNSGTHNNQWLVVDYARFARGAPPAPGLLWVLEQLPGMVESRDLTPALSQMGYFPSYNIPYFPRVFAAAGYAGHANYSTDPRAQMFRAHHVDVHDIPSMCWLMNSNDYLHDPFSKNSSCRAISARCDLLAHGAYAFGGIDSKVVDADTAAAMRVRAISGPSAQTLPAFSFADWPDVPHAGMPKHWEFPWVEMHPARPPARGGGGGRGLGEVTDTRRRRVSVVRLG